MLVYFKNVTLFEGHTPQVEKCNKLLKREAANVLNMFTVMIMLKAYLIPSNTQRIDDIINCT